MTKIIFGDISNKKEFEGMKFIDMHNHSILSDGKDSVSSIITSAKKLNIGVCITDHNEIKGSLQICKEVLSIPSIELTSFERYDLLAYFNSEKDASEFHNKKVAGKKVEIGLFNMWRLKWTMEELAEELDKYNALIALPHPYAHRPKNSYVYFSKTSNAHIFKKIDAVEGINGMLKPYRNKMAIKLAEENNKPIIGGTDSHDSKHLGIVLTGCFADTRTEFIESIRKGNNIVNVRKELSFISRNLAGFGILKNNVSLIKK